MLPLQGLKIISVEQYGAGPFGTMYLVNLGADVIKIENPTSGGDVSRSLGPFFLDGEEHSSNSLFYQQLNHNKRSVTLDLGRKEGRAVLQDLVKSADALASNLRGDVPEKLGLDYANLSRANPKLVCAHLTAYGREGPRADWPGYDYIMQAEAGYFHLTGEPDSPPTRFGLSVIDYMAGVAMAFALLAGVLNARQSGKGRDLDVSLFDVALYNLNYVAAWQMNAGYRQPRVPRSAHFSLTPCQLYRTADGWIYIMCNKEKFWRMFCERLGKPEWIKDHRFLSFKERLQQRDLLTEMIDEVMSTKTTAQWLVEFDGAVPAAPVLDAQQALDNPYVKDSDRIQPVGYRKQDSKGEGSFKVLRGPVRCDDDALPPVAAPALGQHTAEVLQEIGYDEGRIAQLRQQGVV